MIDGIEQLYMKLAESITDAIADDWVAARMDVIFYSDGATFEGEYVRAADGKSRDFPTATVGERAFKELRGKFKEAGKPLWGQATFELKPDGKFNMKLGYDNCDDDGNTIFDEERELKRHEERRQRLAAP